MMTSKVIYQPVVVLMTSNYYTKHCYHNDQYANHYHYNGDQ